MSDSLATPQTVACQAPLSMGFPRQEFWSGLLFPSPGDLPDPGIKPTLPALQMDSLQLNHQGSPLVAITTPESPTTSCHSSGKVGSEYGLLLYVDHFPHGTCLVHGSSLSLSNGLEDKFSCLNCWKVQISKRKITKIDDRSPKDVV